MKAKYKLKTKLLWVVCGGRKGYPLGVFDKLSEAKELAVKLVESTAKERRPPKVSVVQTLQCF